MKNVLLLFTLLFTANLQAQNDFTKDLSEKMEQMQLELLGERTIPSVETRAADVSMKLYTDGTFVVSGEGAMPNFDFDNNIYPQWYDDREQIKAVEISPGITSVGQECFRDCKNLKSVSIANTVTSIGFWAFRDCPGLSSVQLPASVKDISFAAFYSCFSLTNITVDSKNGSYSSVDGVLFNKAKTKLVTYPSGRFGDYTIPGTVTDLGPFSFGLCIGLISINIPSSVKKIEAAAFGLCLLLPALSIPESVKTIETSAFMGCQGLSSINVYWNDPRVVTYGDNIFDYIDNKSTIQLNIPKNSLTSVYKSAYPWKDFYVIATANSDIVGRSIKIYPNPTTDYMIVEGVKTDEKISVYDMKGCLLLTHKATNESEHISIAQLSAGIYFVQIGERQTVKLVKR